MKPQPNNISQIFFPQCGRKNYSQKAYHSNRIKVFFAFFLLSIWTFRCLSLFCFHGINPEYTLSIVCVYDNRTRSTSACCWLCSTRWYSATGLNDWYSSNAISWTMTPGLKQQQKKHTQTILNINCDECTRESYKMIEWLTLLRHTISTNDICV